MANVTKAKEKEKAYGDIIVDFVNARNLSEAYFNLLDDIQTVFGFSSEFRKQIDLSCKYFPKVDDEVIREDLREKYKKYYLNLSNYKDAKEYQNIVCNTVRTLIVDLAKGRGLNNESMLGLLNVYNSYCLPNYDLSSDGLIITKVPFSEKDLTDADPLHNRLGLFRALVYCLVEFLKSDRNKKLLKYCSYCENIFIAKDIKRKTRCYEPECEKAYQRDKKRKQREEDLGTYY